MKVIILGSRVMYSAAWLRSCGVYTGPIPFARGRVVGLETLGATTLAVVDWSDADIPPRVNVKNLEVC